LKKKKVAILKRAEGRAMEVQMEMKTKLILLVALLKLR